MSSWDDYNKIKIVGRGSFGQCVLVERKTDSHKFVIKQINVSDMPDKELTEAANEIRVLSVLRHPNIIGYYGSFINDENFNIILEFADGGDLAHLVKRANGKLFPEKLVLDIFVQIALGLQHVHSKNILHRDLKSQNIFLTRKGVVKLGDFGIAKVLNHTTSFARTVIGTPFYLSPELCEEKEYNQKSDVWALGCLLYEMATLKYAFDANSLPSLIIKILNGQYPPINPRYSEDLRTLANSMLQQDPDLRPSMKNILEMDFLRSSVKRLSPNSEQIKELEMIASKTATAPSFSLKNHISVRSTDKEKIDQIQLSSPSPKLIDDNHNQIDTDTIKQHSDNEEIVLNQKAQLKNCCENFDILKPSDKNQTNTETESSQPSYIKTSYLVNSEPIKKTPNNIIEEY